MDHHKGRTFVVIFALMAFAAGKDALGSGEPSLSAVRVTRKVPHAAESFHDIRTRGPMQAQTRVWNRSVPFHRIQRTPETAIFDARYFTRSVATYSPSRQALAPMAPATDASFAGLGDPPSPNDAIPPDTMGAAGPNHLVSLLNTEFGIFSKSGTLLNRVTLDAFWLSVLSVLPPSVFPFDPRVIYDQHNGRFLAISVAGDNSSSSSLLVAVSDTSDPLLDGWVKVSIDAASNADNAAAIGWADYPALGVDNTNIYVSANMFYDNNDFLYSKVWVIPKSQFRPGIPPVPLQWWEFRDFPGMDSSMQPAHTFGTPQAEYFISEGGLNQLSLASIDNIAGTPNWNPPVSVAVTPYSDISSISGSYLNSEVIPQSGTTKKIDAGDTRLLNAVWQNGRIWTTHHVANAGKTEVAWYRIDPLTKGVVQGRITDPNRWFFYPSIAVNMNGDIAIGFSGSSPTDYAGAYYTVLTSPTWAAQPVTLLKSGVASYYKTLSGTVNRWGDYSATVVDPVDNVTFWTLQEYAAGTNADNTSRWGTWWGKFHPSALAAPTNLTATALSSSQVQLSWTNQSTGTGIRI
ncbi:MAG: hypothetical protein M1550_05365, partial [Deltaproteobacteria bacterium]|nr:hypothetical protein [Deltaproteobacteria bacterium]